MKSSIKRAGLSFFCLALLSCAGSAPPSPPSPWAHGEVAASVAQLPSAAARIKADVDYLASDAMQGRGTGDAGYDAAADYVAERMASIGLAPAFDDSFLQPLILQSIRVDHDRTALSITGADGERKDLEPLEDFRVFPAAGGVARTVEAPAVFVGYGIHAPTLGHDDYEGLNVEGKIVVYFSGGPAFDDSEVRSFFHSTSNKLALAARRGAVGAIGLPTRESEKRFGWERIVRNPESSGEFWIGPAGELSSMVNALPRAYLNAAAAAPLFENNDQSWTQLRQTIEEGGDLSPGPLGLDVALTTSPVVSEIKSANVVGRIEGGDDRLKDQYVVLTAHLDHLGREDGPADKGDDLINNGAIDNALGVAVMIEAARALKADPPARSVLVAAVTAEEMGLLGADYLAHFPPAPIEQIVANVNLDMPVMLHSFSDIVVFGGNRSTLGEIAGKAAQAGGIAVSPDPIPEQGVFLRSDHYRFVQQGVPALFVWPGFENGGEETFNDFFSNHYHQPSDEPSLPILYGDVARFGDVNSAIARAIADAPARPQWIDGDPIGEAVSRSAAQ